MGNKKNSNKNILYYLKDHSIIASIIIIIMLLAAVYTFLPKKAKDKIITNINLTVDKSPQCVGENCQQTVTYNVYNYFNTSIELTPNEQCSKAIESNCSNPIFLNSIEDEPCLNNVTYVDGIIGQSILIDGCDVLFIQPDENPMKSGTISLLVEFNNYTLPKNRYLFDAVDEYNKNRISLYLQPDNFLTFSLFDRDYTSIQIRERLTDAELKDWMQIGITWDESSGTLNLFINENLRKSRSITDIDFDSSFKGIFLGSDAVGKNQAHAILDYIRVISKPQNGRYFEQTYFNLIGKPGYGNAGPVETAPSYK